MTHMYVRTYPTAGHGDAPPPATVIVSPEAPGAVRELAAYQTLIDEARRSVRDPRTVSALLYRQKELERTLRGVDPQMLKEMEEFRTHSLGVMQANRDELREQEMVAREVKKKTKAAADIKKAAAQVTKEHNAKMHDVYLKVDRFDWEKNHFGSSSTTKLSAEHRKNIKEYVTRILPLHLVRSCKVMRKSAQSPAQMSTYVRTYVRTNI